jgi:midasin
LLGQFQPVDKGFVWKDQQLLKNIRNGGRTALIDLNLAQQQVIEGINSLFDYRGSIFVV